MSSVHSMKLMCDLATSIESSKGAQVEPPISVTAQDSSVPPISVTAQDSSLGLSATNNQGLSSTEMEVWNQQYAKSVKADNAQTPVHLRDCRVWRLGFDASKCQEFVNKFQRCPLECLRILLLA
jgi:hypothetical protein